MKSWLKQRLTPLVVLAVVALTGALPSAARAERILVSNGGTSTILRYDADTGAAYGANGNLVDPTLATAGGGGFTNPRGLVVGTDGVLNVTDATTTNPVLFRYDSTTGAFVGSSSVTTPPNFTFGRGMTLGPDGRIYVVAQSTHNVARFTATGAFQFTTPVPGASTFYQSVAVDTNGDLYVYGTSGIIDRLDPTTGVVLSSISTAQSGASGGIGGNSDLTFGPDGNLYVSSRSGAGASSIRRITGYNTGTPTGTAFVTGLSNASGLRFGANGLLYVSSPSANAIFRYDGTTGTPFGVGGNTADATFITGLSSPNFIALEVEPTPEPATLALFGLGACGLFGWKRRQRKTAAEEPE